MNRSVKLETAACYKPGVVPILWMLLSHFTLHIHNDSQRNLLILTCETIGASLFLRTIYRPDTRRHHLDTRQHAT
jgi:hypothetical protein